MCLSNEPTSKQENPNTMEAGNGSGPKTTTTTSNGNSSPASSTHVRSSSPCSSPISSHFQSHHQQHSSTPNSAAAAAAALNLLPSSLLGGLPSRGSPPSLVPSAMSSMVSMASMLGHHGPPFLPPGYHRDFAAAAAAAAAGRNDEFAASMHKFMDRSFGDSPPPPTVPTNDPTANECKIVDYRGEKVAAFMIAGKTMLCLPQAFELFLKHLVGGLHTVYTKLKRLEIVPIVCNVEQVRILRGLGAIQPGVNRCKLLADTDFDALYKDCTTSSSRPGRPPKRGIPFPPMSPQDAMLHLKNSMHNGSAAAAAAAAAAGLDLYKDGPYPKEPRLDKSPFGNGFGPHPPGLSPMAAQFMALNNPAAAAQAAFFSQAGALPPFHGLPVTSSPGLGGRHDPHHLLKGPAGLASLEALHRSGLFGAAYLERIREEHMKAKEDEIRRRDSSPRDSLSKDDRSDSPVLNLSKVNDFRMAAFPSDFSRSDRASSGRDSETGSRREAALAAAASASAAAAGRHNDDDDPHATSSSRRNSLDERRRRYHSDDDIVSDDELDVKSTSGGNGLEGSSDKDCTNNNNKSRSGKVHEDDLDDVADEDEDEDNMNSALGPLAGFQNLLAAAAASGSSAGQGGEAGGEAGSPGQMNSVYGLIGNIQTLLKMAVENAKKEERQLLTQKGHSKTELVREDSSLHKEMEELKKNTAIYFRRFKKEKRVRRRLQEQLELETKKREQMEEALRATSAETLKRITETLAKEMEEKKRQKRLQDEADQAEEEVRRRQVRSAERESDKRRPMTPADDAMDDDDDEEDVTRSRSTSPGQQQQHRFNAKVKTTSTNSDASERVSSPRETPTIGFAKNLFPYNGSSLFGSAN